jgi:beta-lactam-binding protein with PASTA domain
VPKLVGKKLKGARKALAKANCKLGKVNGEKGKTAKIVRQNPKPATTRTAGSAVSVRLG